MSLLRNIASGLRSLFRKDQVDRELDEELGAYLEMEAAEKMKQGMSRKDALRAVRLERGSLEVTKEVVRLCWLGIFCRDLVAGPTLRRPRAGQQSWLHSGRCVGDCSGRWNQCGNLFRAERRRAASASDSSRRTSGQHRSDPSRKNQAQRAQRVQLGFLLGISGLSRPQSRLLGIASL